MNDDVSAAQTGFTALRNSSNCPSSDANYVKLAELAGTRAVLVQLLPLIQGQLLWHCHNLHLVSLNEHECCTVQIHKHMLCTSLCIQPPKKETGNPRP